jgi:glutamine synthetase
MVTIKRDDAVPSGGSAAREPERRHPAKTLPAGLVERFLGKPPSEWTEGDLVDLVFDRGIRLVSLMHVGGDGWLKTLDFVPRGLSHLKDILSGGERADGSSLFKGLGIPPGASDIVLRPRLNTAFLDPFSEMPALVLLCGHHGRDGEPLPQSPATILRRAHERLRRETGTELWALGEIEYFLGKRPAEGDIYGADDRGYHASSPFVFGEPLRRKAMAVLAEIGVPIKYGHSEVGYIEAREPDPVIWEQHEIELALAPLPEAARSVVLTQWVLRNLAHRSGMLCNFAPIVREGHAGNGLHFHLSPVSDGRHVAIRNAEGALAAEAKWLIAGLVTLGASLMAFGNRAQGSFVRLSQGKESPRAIYWGDFDRRALIRLPIVPKTADGRIVSPSTVEFRLPDGSAHPYLLLAGVAQAMLHGRATERIDDLIESASAAGARGSAGPVSPVPRHPREIAEALIAGRAALESGGVFPPVLIDEVLARLGS